MTMLPLTRRHPRFCVMLEPGQERLIVDRLAKDSVFRLAE
jgi:hypothetical protein